MITHIERHDQDSLGLLAISQNVKLNGMGQQESQGASFFFADVWQLFLQVRPFPTGMVQNGPSATEQGLTLFIIAHNSNISSYYNH